PFGGLIINHQLNWWLLTLIPLLREYAKNGMFTKRKKLDINEKSLVELLYDNTYFEYLENNLSESEKK
ncbi:hypothetical protein, partial [Blautia sp. AF19-1]|uniref:hypothetical protein n=1 Tax=Blautia sp. AF19-1 TaxID=2292960 RepID=UPI000FF4D5C0